MRTGGLAELGALRAADVAGPLLLEQRGRLLALGHERALQLRRLRAVLPLLLLERRAALLG